MAKGTDVTGEVEDSKLPTATQAQLVTHETPLATVCVVPLFGVFGTIAQEEPFHDSANVAGDGPLAAAAWPTALHVVALKHETPLSCWLSVVEVFGLGVMAHEEPFHVSMKVWFSGPVPLICPTASQKF
jgi:hypothetical protein